MRTIGSLLFFAALAVAEVEAPLGPYARPGVPVLLRSDRPVTVEIDGWRFAVDGATWVHPEKVPCVVRDEDGQDFLALAAVPEGTKLLGVIGDPPSALGEGVRAVRIDTGGLVAQHWRALDLFDRILVTAPPPADAPWLAALAEWVRAGGSVVAPRDFLAEGSGLGSFHTSLAAAGPIEEPRIPRPGNVRPDLYEAVPPGGLSRTRDLSLIFVVGVGLALAVQVLLAWRGWINRRFLLTGVATVALVGGAVGLWRTRSDYTAAAGGRLVVSYFGGNVERRRTFIVFSQRGPGARAPIGQAHTPILFQIGSDPWWERPGRGSSLGEGVTRIFLVEDVREGTPREAAESPAAGLWGPDRPQSGLVRASVWHPAPGLLEATRDELPVLRRIEVVLQN